MSEKKYQGDLQLLRSDVIFHYLCQDVTCLPCLLVCPLADYTKSSQPIFMLPKPGFRFMFRLFLYIHPFIIYFRDKKLQLGMQTIKFTKKLFVAVRY